MCAAWNRGGHIWRRRWGGNGRSKSWLGTWHLMHCSGTCSMKLVQHTQYLSSISGSMYFNICIQTKCWYACGYQHGKALLILQNKIKLFKCSLSLSAKLIHGLQVQIRVLFLRYFKTATWERGGNIRLQLYIIVYISYWWWSRKDKDFRNYLKKKHFWPPCWLCRGDRAGMLLLPRVHFEVNPNLHTFKWSTFGSCLSVIIWKIRISTSYSCVAFVIFCVNVSISLVDFTCWCSCSLEIKNQ